VSMHAPISDLPIFRPPEERAPAAGPEWSEAQRRVYRELMRYHQGRAAAVKAETLAELVGLDSTRQLQSVVHDLIHVHGIAIGSAMQEPYGYFLARTEAELEAVAKMFDDRARAIRATGNTLRTKGRQEMERRLQDGRSC